ncbi:DUF1127 domain-containing protein [Roseivivax sp. CAU 1761]
MTTADHAAFRGKTSHFEDTKPTWNRLVAWFSRRRESNRVFRELAAMDDRELADIGIARSDIRRIAAQAAADWKA